MQEVAEILHSHSEILRIKLDKIPNKCSKWAVPCLSYWGTGHSQFFKKTTLLFVHYHQRGDEKWRGETGGPSIWCWWSNGGARCLDLVHRSSVRCFNLVRFGLSIWCGWSGGGWFFGLDVVDFFGLGWFLWWLLWWLAVVGMICLEWVAVAYGGFLGWFLEREKILFKG